MRELIKEIWSTSKRNKLRTSLTGFSVAWGIFMLIFLLGAGNGFLNAMIKQHQRYIANSIVVYGSMTSKAYNGLKEGRNIDLNKKDMATTTHSFSYYTNDVGGRLSQHGVNISNGDKYIAAQSLVGVYPSHVKIDKTEMLEGHFINNLDLNEARKSIVLSKNQAKELADNYRSLMGKYVKVNDMAFKVVGIYKGDESHQNSSAYAPFSTVKTIYGKGDEMEAIEFTAQNLPSLEANYTFEEKYRTRININHQADPTDNSAIYISNRNAQNLAMDVVSNLIETALWVVGLFTLLSGIVGVSNIMLITVKERTREFGIRKAIGAKPWAILKLIIAESILMTSFFGYIGMVLGVIANEIMDATIGHTVIDAGLFKTTMFLNPTVGFGTCVGATITIVVAGTIAGLLPAIKAARIRPIEALRAE